MRAVILIGLLGAACALPAPTPLPPGLHSPFTGYSSPLYRNDRMWLCRPDLPNSPCHRDLTATELRADGSRVIVPHLAAPHPDVDCFYVYPTVDLGLLPGNHTDFAHLGPIIDVTVAQAALFDEACAVYVPLYRQITIGTYFWGDKTKRMAVALSDVEDAFLHYMGQYNHGRKVVLIGHSQGAEMVVRLLQQVFDKDPKMRERLLVAMPIGGPLELPATGDATTGGSLTTIPICTSPDERGCVIGYHSYRATQQPLTDWPWDDPPEQRSACVNPAGDTGEHPFSRSYFLASKLDHHGGAATPFVLVRDLYAGACARSAQHVYLSIDERRLPGDLRHPIDLGSRSLGSRFGLHVLDLQFALGDLIDLVKRKARAAPGEVNPLPVE